MRMRWRHPQELSVNFLEEMLFSGGEDEEPLVRHRRQGTGRLGTVATARAGWPIHGPRLTGAHQRLLAIGQQGLKCFCCEAGH
jgi:hypothetical protein